MTPCDTRGRIQGRVPSLSYPGQTVFDPGQHALANGSGPSDMRGRGRDRQSGAFSGGNRVYPTRSPTVFGVGPSALLPPPIPCPGKGARTVFGEGLAEDRMHATTSGEALTEWVPGDALDGWVPLVTEWGGALTLTYPC